MHRYSPPVKQGKGSYASNAIKNERLEDHNIKESRMSSNLVFILLDSGATSFSIGVNNSSISLLSQRLEGDVWDKRYKRRGLHVIRRFLFQELLLLED